MVYGWWQFPRPLLRDLTFTVEVRAGDERVPGRYFQLYQGCIGGIGFYFGFQTNVWHPQEGGKGRGLIFSRWGTRDSGDAREVRGGWVENSDHEGDFIGVRALFDWRTGTKYVCRLRPVDQGPSGMWYEFGVLDGAGSDLASPGSLRFPSQHGQPPFIHSGGGSWTEAYNPSPTSDEDVPLTHFVIHKAIADEGTVSPATCTTEQRFGAADAFFDTGGALHLVSGRGVVGNHPAQTYHLLAFTP